MITFNKISWSNFMSYGNYPTEVRLDQYHKTLIVGKSGSGKSVLIDAITFALFGKPYRNINKPALTNRLTDKNTLVEIEFTIGKRHFLVRRGIKPNIFEIFENGDLIRQDSLSRDYQAHLENNILKINYKSFCQIIILGTATYVPFMELPALQRRTVVEDLLDLQVFSAMNNILKDRIAANKDGLAVVEQNIRLLTSNLELHESHLKDIKTDIKDRAKELKTKIIEQVERIKYDDSEIIRIQDELSQLQTIIDSFEGAHSIKNQCIRHATKQNKLIAKWEKERTFYIDTCECPTCAQNISEDFKKAEIAKRDKCIEAAIEIVSKCDKKLKKIEKKLEECDANYMVKHHLESTINTLRLDKASAKTLKTSYEIDLAGLKEKYQTVDTSMREDFQKQLTEANAQKADLLDQREVLNVASTLLKDGGIKSLIIRQYIPIMNKIIKQYLGQMNLFVDFSLDENFEEVFGGINNQNNSYYAHSEGEKKRINLAIMFAWRNIARIRQNANSNLLIFDEILDSSLDQDGRDDFMNVLNAMTDTNIVIISHNTDSITDKFDATLKFEKKKAFSKIMETA